MQSIWILNVVHVTTMKRYSMMKEIFVCTVGTKLKKYHKRRSAIVFTDNFRIGDR